MPNSSMGGHASERAHRARSTTQLSPKVKGRLAGILTRLLNSFDSAVYLLVGACFLVAALISLIYGVLKFAYSVYVILSAGSGGLSNAGSVAEAIITFVSDLLLTLIIMEVLGTVINYLETRATSLKPFLFIGIISATRGILAVGARLSVSDFAQLGPSQFRDSMVELGVNAAVIIALGVTLKLIGDFLDEEPLLEEPMIDTNPDNAPTFTA